MSALPNSLHTFAAVALAALTALCASAAAAAPAPAKAPEDSARAIFERCRSADFSKERDCYAAALDKELASVGPAPVLRLLDGLVELDPDVRRDGHFYAHRIGISALKSPSEVSRVFESCTPAYQAGCYHGVIQSYFLATEREGGGITTESVEALCGGYRERRSDLLFQCTHGLGHGLAILHGHDLPRALRSCDLLSREPEREMCYAGGFMESLVNTTHPHSVPIAGKAKSGSKTPKAAASHPGHGPHDRHGAASAAAGPETPPFRALDPADLHYPCSKMGEKYLVACYTIQTSAMLHHNGGNVGGAAAECRRAPEKARTTCFISLGRDVNSISTDNVYQAAQLCGLAEKAFRSDCHRGVVQSIINTNSNPAEGIPYCRAVFDPEGKSACYAALGLQALGLPDGQAGREQACRLAEAGLVDICLGRPAPPAPRAAS